MADTDLLYLEQAISSGVLFVHIPKCGGTSIKSALELELINHPLLCDMIAAGLPAKTKTVTIVRNPFDRLASAYEHLKKGQKLNRAFKTLILDNHINFDDFVLNWLNESNIRKWIHFLPQTEFLTWNENISVDHIFKLENINSSWEEISRIFDKNSPMIWENSSNRSKISDYYKDPRVVEKTIKLYEQDFINFDYSLTVP